MFRTTPDHPNPAPAPGLAQGSPANCRIRVMPIIEAAELSSLWSEPPGFGHNGGLPLDAPRRPGRPTCWLECLDDPPSDGCEYVPTAESLKAWIDRRWDEWFENPIAELEHRDAIREQVFGAAYGTQKLETSARYEVHLDRKLERTLSMLIRLRDLRPPKEPG